MRKSYRICYEPDEVEQLNGDDEGVSATISTKYLLTPLRSQITFLLMAHLVCLLFHLLRLGLQAKQYVVTLSVSTLYLID